MTSRLDRLFILLESGSSAVTRRAAARQIGEVQKLHPHELHNLLNRLTTYLYSTSWETRIAASQTVEAILNNVPKWDPLPLVKKEEEEEDNSTNKQNLLSFNMFNLDLVLQNGARLMGSEGTEFDFTLDEGNGNGNLSREEQLKRQQKFINDRLGLSQGMTLEQIVTLDDVQPVLKAEPPEMQNSRLIPVQDLFHNITKSDDCASSLSCREKNRARRKARQVNTNPTISQPGSSNGGNGVEEPAKKKIKTEAVVKAEKVEKSSDPVPDGTGSWGDAIRWPFESFCTRLFSDLFSPRWETRHGAATALREVLKIHSDGAGKNADMTLKQMELEHQNWLEDASIRLLCVLSLDRFGDFVSDQVIAPVRETCAQVLGAILKKMPKEKVFSTIEILIKLVKHKDWEVRHGGLLGIKYLLVVREDYLQLIIPQVINHILMGLFDGVDDVSSVAATTLIPIASWLPKLLSPIEVSNIVKMLWDLLLEQDELTAACNSFMGLLAAILSLPNAPSWIQMESMDQLVPRLWPFLCHNTSSVRRSTLLTLKTLTKRTDELENNSELNKEQHSSGLAILNKESKLNIQFGVKEWHPKLLQDSLRHIYQRILVEHLEDIQQLVEEVWNNLIENAELAALLYAACPYVASWLCLAMQPARLAFDINSLISVQPMVQSKKRNDLGIDDSGPKLLPKYFLGGSETIPSDVREKNVMKARFKACQMLGKLSKYLVLPAPGVPYTDGMESPIECYSKLQLGHLQSRSALQRLVSGMVISFWAASDPSINPGPQSVQDRLKVALVENIYYDECTAMFARLLQESRDFLVTLKQYKVSLPEFENCTVLNLDQIRNLSSVSTEILKQKHSLRVKVAELIEDRRRGLSNSFKQTSIEQSTYNICTQAILAGATISLGCLPEKLNPVIKPIMESLKKEECEILQKLSAYFLVRLLDQVKDRNPSPNNKIVTNLSVLLKSDSDFTPKIIIPTKKPQDFDSKEIGDQNPVHGILTLNNQQKQLKTTNGAGTRGPGRPPTHNIEVNPDEILDPEDPNRKINQIQKTGAVAAIVEICKFFKEDLPQKVPRIWELFHFEGILSFNDDKVHCILTEGHLNAEELNDILTSLQLIEVSVVHIDRKLENEVFELLPKLCLLIKHPLNAIRHMASRCVAIFAEVNPGRVMNVVMNFVVPLLNDSTIIYRQGATEVIACIVNKLQFGIVPYVVLLIVPILGRMSDFDQSVRLMSTQCFATLIQLMPLDGSAPNFPQMSKDLLERKERDRKFLEHLFTPKTIPNFKIPKEIKAELRSYQQSGVNWLWFLNKYNLHGILCDDMGLGKTLQTICALAGDHRQRADEGLPSLPSLVICPPTLTGHWVYEVNKFIAEHFLKPIHYVGLPPDREKLRNKMASYNLVIASYDIVRKDIEFFRTVNWNYCVLDEGHIIKNGKTKCSKAIKLLVANHRLILSGTPIQNNVLELWSLFDFLMPGFLGTEKQFVVRFSKPILASRDAKSSPKEQEAGALAMETLHRQVLPFLLRRVKEDVLMDLPPKITQDLLCELSPLQEKLYEDFSRTHFKNDLQECFQSITTNGDGGAGNQIINKKTHVFQALRYLQNVCNHPKLVLNPHHPEYDSIQKSLHNSLDDIEHSAKLPALKQLLLDCGIGIEDISINQHRALIFCQLKAMLDIVENDLLKKHLPAVTYLRLDGSVPPSSRHEIVTKFNNDPSIDVLLLTTQVGGLGLNLTGADTVIFVEHDWNPMKDLQAMDRAHRIGQRKVVNVYRLITRKSLEEKIMCLQKFKLLTANTVVSDENASMDTMGTDQLLDLFNLTDDETKKKNVDGSKTTGMKSVLETLPELWEDRQYEEEYDLTQFLDGLNKN